MPLPMASMRAVIEIGARRRQVPKEKQRIVAATRLPDRTWKASLSGRLKANLDILPRSVKASLFFPPSFRPRPHQIRVGCVGERTCDRMVLDTVLRVIIKCI